MLTAVVADAYVGNSEFLKCVLFSDISTVAAPVLRKRQHTPNLEIGLILSVGRQVVCRFHNIIKQLYNIQPWQYKDSYPEAQFPDAVPFLSDHSLVL